MATTDRITETYDRFNRQWLAIDGTPAFLIGDTTSSTAITRDGKTFDIAHFGQMTSALIAEDNLDARAVYARKHTEFAA